MFTVTTGRSGTMYLTEMLKKHLKDVESHHEIMWGFDKFGVDTPDVSDFHEFNNRGNTTKIVKFWMRKLNKISKTKNKYYVETSHLLAKAGLVENIGLLKDYGTIHLVFLKRSVFKTLLSLYKRNTFLNVDSVWMWYLDPNYSKNIVDFSPYKRFGIDGMRLWYIHEMLARAEYYKQLLKMDKKINLIEADIDDLNSKEGVGELLEKLGCEMKNKDIKIISPKNESQNAQYMNSHVADKSRKIIDSFEFNAKKLAIGYIEAGRRIG